MKQVCYPNILWMIYMTCVYNTLNYCLLVWGILISQEENNKIKVLQNACIRILTNGVLRQSTLSVYKAFNSNRFVEMVKQSLVLFMYKYTKVCCQFL